MRLGAVRPARYCSPLRRMQCNTRHEGSKCVGCQGLADIARHVIGCNQTQATRVEIALDAVAGDIRQALPPHPPAGMEAGMNPHCYRRRRTIHARDLGAGGYCSLVIQRTLNPRLLSLKASYDVASKRPPGLTLPPAVVAPHRVIPVRVPSAASASASISVFVSVPVSVAVAISQSPHAEGASQDELPWHAHLLPGVYHVGPVVELQQEGSAKYCPPRHETNFSSLVS